MVKDFNLLLQAPQALPPETRNPHMDVSLIITTDLNIHGNSVSSVVYLLLLPWMLHPTSLPQQRELRWSCSWDFQSFVVHPLLSSRSTLHATNIHTNFITNLLVQFRLGLTMFNMTCNQHEYDIRPDNFNTICQLTWTWSISSFDKTRDLITYVPWGKEASDLPHAPLSSSASSANATNPSAVIPQYKGTFPSWSCLRIYN